ncbi:pyrroline-5-carboxylate reductase [Sinomonas sp. P10A9]|uniref:Pyrroline-5-carboxylate reductase n=1 Tax=Sinomonas puerhi TaxID=3238584 RepID=A0AB39L351_9MICC
MAATDHLAFLGCGSMNEAILAGLLAAGLPKEAATATVRRHGRAEELAGHYGITVLAADDTSDANRRAVGDASLVIIGVRPVDVSALATEIAPALPHSAVVVSVAAAVTIGQLEHLLPPGQPVVRVLPNSPSRLGSGVIAVCGGTGASREQVDHVKGLLAALGLVVEVPEEHIDVVSAVSGSGPAYAFYLALAMADAGTRLGLDRGLAADIARQTLVGAGRLLAEPGADPAALLGPFVGPDTTTGGAIDVFDERGLCAIIADAVRAAHERSEALARRLG